MLQGPAASAPLVTGLADAQECTPVGMPKGMSQVTASLYAGTRQRRGHTVTREPTRQTDRQGRCGAPPGGCWAGGGRLPLRRQAGACQQQDASVGSSWAVYGVVGCLPRVHFALPRNAYAVAPTRRAGASGTSWSRVTVAVYGMRRRCCGSACASRRHRRGADAVAGMEGLPSEPACCARTAGADPGWGRRSHTRAPEA